MLLPLRSSRDLPVFSARISSDCLPALMLPRLCVALWTISLLAGCQTPLSSSTVLSDTVFSDAVLSDVQAIDRSSASSPTNRGQLSSSDIYKPAPMRKPRPSWADSIDALYLRARAEVELELEVDLASIRLLLVDDSPIDEEVTRETRRLVTEQFGLSDFADQFLHRVMKSQSGTYAALFTSRLQAVMVNRGMLASYEQSLPDDPRIRASALLTLLIHELVHAADDQRYRIHENRALNFRASFAQSATFEGHAQWVTRRICARAGCTDGLAALDDFMFSRHGQTHQLTQPVEAISRNVLEYSYIEGERFIAALAERADGAELIDQLLRNPPFDPVQILAPERYPDTERERQNQRLIRASLNVDHPWVHGRWIGVETSPLKGVNLRADPSRRQAAVDGFTRLIQSMVAMQLYDRDRPEANPMEVTLLQAESASTASLFARTLHDNSQLDGAYVDEEELRVDTGAGREQSGMRMYVYRTSLDNGTPFRTVIGVSGPYVVQIAGRSRSLEPMDDYTIRVLLNLQLPL